MNKFLKKTIASKNIQFVFHVSKAGRSWNAEQVLYFCEALTLNATVVPLFSLRENRKISDEDEF